MFIIKNKKLFILINKTVYLIRIIRMIDLTDKEVKMARLEANNMIEEINREIERAWLDGGIHLVNTMKEMEEMGEESDKIVMGRLTGMFTVLGCGFGLLVIVVMYKQYVA